MRNMAASGKACKVPEGMRWLVACAVFALKLSPVNTRFWRWQTLLAWQLSVC